MYILSSSDRLFCLLYHSLLQHAISSERKEHKRLLSGAIIGFTNVLIHLLSIRVFSTILFTYRQCHLKHYSPSQCNDKQNIFFFIKKGETKTKQQMKITIQQFSSIRSYAFLFFPIIKKQKCKQRRVSYHNKTQFYCFNLKFWQMNFKKYLIFSSKKFPSWDQAPEFSGGVETNDSKHNS